MDHLPPSLTHLSFGYSFNRQVNNLPSSLKYLAFGIAFDQSVDHLPDLDSITFNSFSKSISLLPQTLTKLTILGYNFNGQIPSLPHLTHLIISTFAFNQPVDHLSPTIVSLEISGHSFQHKIPLLPSLTHLRCKSESISAIPSSLTSLDCLTPCKKQHNTMDLISSSSISHLVLASSRELQEQPISLPHSLKTLVSNTWWDDAKLDNIPASLTHLLQFFSTQPVQSLPPNLTHLSFGPRFNESLHGKLPQTLLSLELGESYCQPLHSLPASLKALSSMSFLLYSCIFSFVLYSILTYFVLVTRHLNTRVLGRPQNATETHIAIPPTLASLIVSLCLFYCSCSCFFFWYQDQIRTPVASRDGIVSKGL